MYFSCLATQADEKATSHLLLEPDWNAILQICDTIRGGDTQPRYAIACIKKKMYHQNPHVALLSLQVLESCVKNCGVGVHEEVATKSFMEELRDLAKSTKDDTVKNKILELVQAWAYAFRNSSRYRSVQDTLNIMKAEGFTFPTLKESDAMFAADTAPDWVEGDNCHRCRVQFSLTQRKHHCRACGQVFCGKCSSKACVLPKFGIEKEVRVCDACWDKHNGDSSSSDSGDSPDHTPRTARSTPAVKSPGAAVSSAPKTGKSEEELKEEEDLLLAMALSKSEAEEKEKMKLRQTAVILNRTPTKVEQLSPRADKKLEPEPEPDNPELARYLNRTYWEKKATSRPDATVTTNQVGGIAVDAKKTTAEPPSVRVTEKYQNGETDYIDDFALNLRNQIEMFVNRMKSNSSRGRHIANDTSVQTIFMNITTMHAQLLQHIQELDQKRGYYEGLQDKLSQARDARGALDALREEYREKLRRAAEEAEHQRQMQMAMKLDIMRKKKQEYLEYQRQLAMQRIQEQEREMQLRMEQQKQMYLRSSGGYPPQGPYIQPPGGPIYQPPQQPYPGSAGPMPGAGYMPQQAQQYPPVGYGAPMPGGINPHMPPPGAQYGGIPQQQQGPGLQAPHMTMMPPGPMSPQHQYAPAGPPPGPHPNYGMQHQPSVPPPGSYGYPGPGAESNQGYNVQYAAPPPSVQQINQPAPSAPAPTPDIGELISFD